MKSNIVASLNAASSAKAVFTIQYNKSRHDKLQVPTVSCYHPLENHITFSYMSYCTYLFIHPDLFHSAKLGRMKSYLIKEINIWTQWDSSNFQFNSLVAFGWTLTVAPRKAYRAGKYVNCAISWRLIRDQNMSGWAKISFFLFIPIKFLDLCYLIAQTKIAFVPCTKNSRWAIAYTSITISPIKTTSSYSFWNKDLAWPYFQLKYRTQIQAYCQKIWICTALQDFIKVKESGNELGVIFPLTLIIRFCPHLKITIPCFFLFNATLRISSVVTFDTKLN